MTWGEIYCLFKKIESIDHALNGSVLCQVRLSQTQIILVRVLAGVTSQIISLQTLIGNKVRLRTRELFNCISARASWNAPVIVTMLLLASSYSVNLI